jgi:electron transfer flavoprotein alpha subunit
MRIAALVKQIPAFEEMELGDDGRLRRDGIELEMNPYCRRAVSQAVELAAAVGDGTVTVFTLGPPSADDTLREAIAWGRAANVATDGVLITDPAFAGSDTLATARALAAALERNGPFDLIVVGRNSVDADTGQVGPELAELLDLPFATGVRHLSLSRTTLHLRCEHDDGWVQAEIELPAIISTAERLIDPCKMPPEERATVPAEMITSLSAADLGSGPWGAAASPTSVGRVRMHDVARDRVVLDGPIAAQVHDAVELLERRGALDGDSGEPDWAGTVGPPRTGGTPVAVVLEPDRTNVARELLGAAAELAAAIDSHVVALSDDSYDVADLAAWGSDAIVRFDSDIVEAEIARSVADWAGAAAPWAILAPSTAWGREVSARAAARLGAGLTGDAVALEIDDGRLVAWKPAFGDQLVAAITASSPIQMATVRAGVLSTPSPRTGAEPTVNRLPAPALGRVRVLARTRDDDLDVLADAPVVVGVGMGVDPSDYDALDPLLHVLGAELGATRKVTDKGWLPRARQIGITGRTLAPRLYVALGLGGKFNHMVGVRAAGTILAINPEPEALVFAAADIGIVGDWRDAVPLLVSEIERATISPARR